MNIPPNRRCFLFTAGAAGLATVVAPRTWAAPTAAVGPFKLPPLAYGFDALEPSIDAKTMEIHHDKHHAAYVEKLNAAVAGKADLVAQPLEKLVSGVGAIADDPTRTAVRNHGGGHWNHDFFWKVMSPHDKAGAPAGDLLAGLNGTFGSVAKFQELFAAAAAGRFGSGWAWLVVADKKFKITTTANQDNPLMAGIVPAADLGTPLLGIDVWEHAYYLRYQNRRPDYVKAWWEIVNWNEVAARLVVGG